MSKIALSPDANGAGIFTIASPNSGTDRTLTLPDNTGTLVSTGSSAVVTPTMLSQPFTSGTAKAYNWNGLTNNTVLDFTGIPSWVKRITVMFQGLSTNGSSVIQVQIGAGSVSSSGYTNTAGTVTTTSNTTRGASATSGILTYGAGSATGYFFSGTIVFFTLGSNIWVASGVINNTGAPDVTSTAGTITLGGTLDRVRVTTVNGTDTFDAGTVNILYE